jgi:hypothetical protein
MDVESTIRNTFPHVNNSRHRYADLCDYFNHVLLLVKCTFGMLKTFPALSLALRKSISQELSYVDCVHD